MKIREQEISDILAFDKHCERIELKKAKTIELAIRLLETNIPFTYNGWSTISNGSMVIKLDDVSNIYMIDYELEDKRICDCARTVDVVIDIIKNRGEVNENN